jgi:serine protease Do
MHRSRNRWLSLPLFICWMGCCLVAISSVWADEPAKTNPDTRTTTDGSPEPTPAVPPKTLTVQEITEKARPSLVTITVAGREGGQRGLGTGFVIAPNLVATNLHVIGEGFPFTAELADGTNLEVKAIHASDHELDLAILEVSAGEKQLQPLPLGDSAALPQGAAVAVLGNPLGFKHSVVAGIVSAKREVNNREMLQLAIPIEPGNSGGPVLDMQGRVVGLVNMKSTVEHNLGFAIQIDSLKPLLEKPNPVTITRWITIGGIDPKRWQPLMGAAWRQRAGRIQVTGSGDGFGGRSLCLSQSPVPELPFELGVQVKLDDESGAAGIVFHADGSNKHYGFYPSNGNMRLSCFQGADVRTWQVLEERPSDAYRPGEWNHLKVRIEKEKLQCFVNGELVMESADQTLTSGKVGLAKFRQTVAEFKQFQIGPNVSFQQISAEELKSVRETVEKLPEQGELTPDKLAELVTPNGASVATLRRRAAELESRAAELRHIASDVHVAQMAAELAKLVQNRDDQFDLLRAALVIAKLEEEDIDVDGYIAQVDQMAAEIQASLPKDADEAAKLAALNDYLFQQNGYHGNRFDYYHRANSLMNRVIDDRAGMPITLSVLYMELGRRIGLKIEGVGLPAHFVVRWIPTDGEPHLIDVFDRGKNLTREDAAKMVLELSGNPLQDENLVAQSPRQILRRVIGNLWNVATDDRDGEALLRLVEVRMAVDPDSLENRVERYRWRSTTGRFAAAVADLDWIIQQAPPGIDLEAVRAAREQLRHRTGR